MDFNSYVELRRGLVDLGSSFNIMPMSTIETVGVPQDRVAEQTIELSRFGSNTSFTTGYINVNLTIKPIIAATRFYILNSRTSYHLLLESLEFISTKPRPPRITNISKPLYRQESTCKRVEAPFQKEEAYFSDIAFFDKLMKDN